MGPRGVVLSVYGEGPQQQGPVLTVRTISFCCRGEFWARDLCLHCHLYGSYPGTAFAPPATSGCLGEPLLLCASLFCSGNGMPGCHPLSIPQLFWSSVLHSRASFSSCLVTCSHQQTSSSIFQLWKTFYLPHIYPSPDFFFNNLPTRCSYLLLLIHTSVSSALVPVTQWHAHFNFVSDLRIAQLRNYFSIPIKLNLSATSKHLFIVVPQFLAYTWYVVGTQWILWWWLKEWIISIPHLSFYICVTDLKQFT